jgi:ankyrin repeat protein
LELLLSRGANIQAEDHRQYTALVWASEPREVKETTMKLLLDNGALTDGNSYGAGMALVILSGKGNNSMVKLLLDRGVNAKGWAGRRAMDCASHMGFRSTVRLLFAKGARF